MTGRYYSWIAWCANPECERSRATHPVRGCLTVYGLGTIGPESDLGSECPACGSGLAERPVARSAR